MFFRVVETSRVDGKTRVTVEAKNSSVQLLLQFLATASEFAYTFRYKSEADLKAKDRAAERIAAEPSRAHGKDILSLNLSVKGVPQHKRYQLIREVMKARGSITRCCPGCGKRIGTRETTRLMEGKLSGCKFQL